MLKNRSFTLKIEKPQADTETEPRETRTFEEKLDYVLEKGERVAIIGLGFLASYVLLDTFRQVSIERARHD